MASGDIKTAYGASSALAITLASLAASSTLVAGVESDAVDNTANLYLDYVLAGKVTTGTTPTAGQIEVWVMALASDTPDWPDVFDGTGSAETVTSADIKAASGALAQIIPTDTTSNRTYPVKSVSVASLFGGVLPKKFVVFVTHSTVAALNATAGNHAMWVTPVYQTVAP